MKQFCIEQRKTFDTEYVKVDLFDEKRNVEIQSALSKLDCVKKVNITHNNKETLTVYPKKMFSGKDLECRINKFLESYFNGVVDKSEAVENEAYFNDIQNRILDALDKAKVSILLAMSWFTNDILLNKLVQKQNSGVEVKVLIFDDDTNEKYGVNFTLLNTVRKAKIKGGGIMHNKFCVIDTQVIITGSYNWTKKAETRNKENITVQYDPKSAIDFSVEFNELFRNALDDNF